MRTPISLNVLTPQARTPHAGLRRWRLASLVAVHLLIVGHLVHYAVAGHSLSPAVMSDSMRTIELGQVTCGVLMFGAALLTSLVFGRFICGWACHMGALQDLAGWALKRFNLKPQPLRSRWLGWTPLAAAFYLFLWPTLKREAFIPAAESLWPAAASWLGRVAPRPDGFTNQIITDDFWAGLPRWQVAVPFLLICGVLSVVFLGTRGVCRYVCPYGGFLDPAAKLAPISIAIDAALCDSCGLCTKACDVGVRVMEETAAVGRVVSSRCVRSLDCVAACPQGALLLKPVKPGLLSALPKGARPLYSLSLKEEVLVTAVGLLSFVVLRGAYDAFPLLMAIGASACVAGTGLWTARLLTKPAVSVLSRTVKQQRRLKPAAYAIIGVTVCAALLLAHTAAVRVVLLRAGALDDAVTVSAADAYAGRATEAQRADAQRALRLYGAAMSAGSGGFALFDTPSAQLRMAWLSLVAGDLPRTEHLVSAVIDREGPNDSLLLQRAQVTIKLGKRSEAIGDLASAARDHPRLLRTATAAASLLSADGRAKEARGVLTGCRDARPWDPETHARLADFELSVGNTAAALDGLRSAAAMTHATAEIRARCLVLESLAGDPAQAEVAVHDWLLADAKSTRLAVEQAVLQLRQNGRPEAAERLLQRLPR